MAGCRPSTGSTLRFLGFANGLGPFFFFSSWAEAVKHITKASDTTSKRMDELYTMGRPRQMLILPMRRLPKIWGGSHESGALAAGLAARCRYKARRTAPLAGCAIHAATSQSYPRPIECEGKENESFKIHRNCN